MSLNCTLYLFLFFSFFEDFVYLREIARERERESTRREEREKQALCKQEAQFQDPEIMT